MNIIGTTTAIVLGAALLALPAPASAAPLTRQRAIAEALRQNPQIAAARARREQAEADQARADAARWPEVTVELGVGPSLKAELVPGTAVGSTKSRYDLAAEDLSIALGGRLNVVQPLYTFGKIDSYRAAARYGVLAREAQIEITRGEIALEVARLYEGLLFARDSARFFEEVQGSLERTVVATEERVKAGAPELGEQDVLRLEAAVAAARLVLHHAQAGQTQATAGLVAYLGMPDRSTIEPSEGELAALPSASTPEAQLSSAALRRRPELSALDEGGRAYDALAAAERAGDLPDVFLLAFASGAYTPGRDLVESRYVIDPLHHFDPGLLLGLRWRMQGSGSSALGDQREAQARELRAQRRWAATGIPAQVKKAYADSERARRDIAEIGPAVVKAKRWMVQANADFVVGLADSAAVVDATRAYAELRGAGLDALYRHNVALAELAYATGDLTDQDPGLYPGKATP